MNLKPLLLFGLLAIGFVGCSDDDNDNLSKKELTFDGTKYTFEFGGINAYYLNEGNFDIGFYNEVNDDYLSIQLSRAWDGKNVDLSKLDRDNDWTYRIQLESQDKTEMYIMGNYESDFEDVKRSGTLFIKTINEKKNLYEIKINLIVEGKKLKMHYKGKLDLWEDK
jgi:hypothetical protein